MLYEYQISECSKGWVKVGGKVSQKIGDRIGKYKLNLKGQVGFVTGNIGETSKWIKDEEQ